MSAGPPAPKHHAELEHELLTQHERELTRVALAKLDGEGCEGHALSPGHWIDSFPPCMLFQEGSRSSWPGSATTGALSTTACWRGDTHQMGCG